jgi:hypothetical protein
MKKYFVGVDLGQSVDYTAIAVVERAEEKGAWDPVAYAWRRKVSMGLRYLERIPLGTPYPDVVARVREVVKTAELEGNCQLAVDATGVGRPVVDMMRAAGLGRVLWPVTITGGDTESQSNGFHRVPQRDLIVGVQTILQLGLLQIAAGLEHGPVLVEEMAGMRVRITERGREQYGSSREGTHDDLVFAVALAMWCVRKRHPNLGGDAGYWQTETGRLVGAGQVPIF